MRVSSPPPQSHQRYERIFAELEAPFAFVDLDAMWSNADQLLERAGRKPIRVATKSIRCRALIEEILGRDARFSGLMTYTLPETLGLGATRARGSAPRLPDPRRLGAAGAGAALGRRSGAGAGGDGRLR